MGMNGSLVLAADQPAALARFYGELLEVEPQSGLSASHWRLPWPAGGWLEVYGPSRSRPQPRQQGRLALCLQRHADGSAAAGAVWCRGLATGPGEKPPAAAGVAVRVGSNTYGVIQREHKSLPVKSLSTASFRLM
jgi:hypothetical protein